MISVPNVESQSQQEDNLQQNSVAIPDPMNGVATVSDERTNLKAFQTALINTALNPQADTDLIQQTQKNFESYQFGAGKAIEENTINQAKADTMKQWESLLGQMQNDIPTDPEAQKNLQELLVNDAFVQQQIEDQYNSDPHVLAKEAAMQMSNLKSADPALDELLVFGQENSNLVKTVEQNVKRNLMLQNAIDDVQQEDEKQGTLFWAIDKISSMVAAPLNVVHWLRASTQFDDKVNLGFLHKTEALVKMRRQLDKMSDDEFEKKFPLFIQKLKDTSAIFGDNEGRVLDVLNGIKNEEATNTTLTGTNFWNAIEAIPVVQTTVTAPFTIARALAKVGAKTVLAETAANVATDGAENAVLKTGEAADLITLPVFKKTDIPTGVSALTDKMIAQTEALREAVKKVPMGETNNPVELQKAMDETVKALDSKYARYGVIEANVTDTDFTVGANMPKVELTIGRRDGKGWVTKIAAENAAKKLGFNPNQLGQDASTGEWFLKVKHDVDYLNRSIQPLEQIDTFFRGFLGNGADLFSSNAAKLDQFLMGTASVNRAATESFQKVLQPVIENLRVLNKAERIRLKELAVKSLDEEKWFSYKDLVKKGYSEKEIAGYYAYKELNDTSWFVANEALYKELRFKGYKDISIKVEGNNPWEVPTLSGIEINSTDSIRPDIKRIWFADEGKFLEGGTDNLKAMVESGKYKLIKYSDAIETPKGEPVQFVIAGTKHIDIKDLDRIQLEYLAGGRRSYAGKYFVKQANKGVYEDTGQSYIRGAFTHAAETSPKAAREYVQKWNEAIKDFISIRDGKVKGVKATALKAKLVDYTGLTYKEITAKVADGKMSLEPMEVVYDRDVPSFMRVENRGFSGPGADVDEGFRQYFSNFGIQGTLQARYKGFTNKRGGLLHDAEGNPAALLDPFEATDRAISNSIRYGMWNTWRQRAIQQWTEAAQKSKLYSSTDSLTHESGNFDRLTHIKTSNPEELARIRDLEAQREAIKRILNYKLPEQVWWESNVRKVAQSTFGDKFGLNGMDINSADPFTAVRSMAFHAKLGLFNPTQFLLQAAHMPVMFALFPSHFMKGMMAQLPMAHIAATAGRKDIIKEYGKMAKLMGFNDAKEWENFSDMFLSSGWHDIGGTTQYLDNVGMGSTNVLGSKMSKLLEMGRKPFDLGEQISRRHAYYIAYMNVKQSYPKMSMTSAEARRLVMQDANRVSFNMNSEFAGRLSKGLTSIPMQFKTYMFRYLEAFTGRQFSLQQKVQLAAGTIALYGANAMPGFLEGEQWLEKNYGTSLPPEAWKVLRNGLFDSMFYLGSDGEINTDFSRRVGLGASIQQEYRKIFNPDTQSVFDFFTGPVGSTVITPATEAYWMMSTYARAEQGGFTNLINKSMVPKVLNNISTFSTGMKAWYAYKYQMALSNKTLSPIAPVSQAQSIFTILGLPPAVEGQFGDAIYDLQKNKEYIDKAADVVVRFRNEVAMNPSVELFSENAEATAQFLSAFDDNEKMQIISKANVKMNREGGMAGLIEAMQKIRPNGTYSNMEYVNKTLQLDKQFNNNEDNQ